MKNYSAIVIARTLKLISGVIFAGALASTAIPAISSPMCGPGIDWVNTCPPGQDPIYGTFNVSFEWLADDLGPLLTRNIYDLALYGLTTVTRDDPAGTGQINTEIIAAQGEQLHPTLGPLTLRIGTQNGVATRTIGEVNQIPLSLFADSFFDVFFELDSLLGTPIYNLDPLRVVAKLTCLAPGMTDPDTGLDCAGGVRQGYDAVGPLPFLYGDLGFGEQVVARVVEELTANAPPHHHTPEPATFALFGLGLAGLGWVRHKNSIGSSDRSVGARAVKTC